jgi:hypothetical protein
MPTAKCSLKTANSISPPQLSLVRDYLVAYLFGLMIQAQYSSTDLPSVAASNRTESSRIFFTTTTINTLKRTNSAVIPPQ